MRYLLKKLTTKYSTNALWALGIPLWVFYPIVLTLLSIAFFHNELGIAAQFTTCLVNAVYILYTAILLFRVYRFNESTHLIRLRYITTSLIAIMFGYYIYMNFVPERIENTGTYIDSPFEQYWYYLDQTNYGFPLPFLRYFDDPVGKYNTIIFDASTLSTNIVLFCFPAYLLLGLDLLIQARVIHYRKRKAGIPQYEDAPSEGTMNK